MVVGGWVGRSLYIRKGKETRLARRCRSLCKAESVQGRGGAGILLSKIPP